MEDRTIGDELRYRYGNLDLPDPQASSKMWLRMPCPVCGNTNLRAGAINYTDGVYWCHACQYCITVGESADSRNKAIRRQWAQIKIAASLITKQFAYKNGHTWITYQDARGWACDLVDGYVNGKLGGKNDSGAYRKWKIKIAKANDGEVLDDVLDSYVLAALKGDLINLTRALISSVALAEGEARC